MYILRRRVRVSQWEDFIRSNGPLQSRVYEVRLDIFFEVTLQTEVRTYRRELKISLRLKLCFFELLMNNELC